LKLSISTMDKNLNKRSADKILRNIYTENGKMPDFHSIEIKKEKRTKKILVLMIVFFAFLAASAWAGFFVFKPYARLGGGEVKFEIRGPEKIIAGKETDFDVLVENDSNVPLAETSIFLILPPDFSLIKSDPAAQTPNNWLLGTLETGGKHTISLRGIVTKEVGGDFLLNATLTYKPANFNSEFQNVASYKAGIGDTILETAIDGPAEVLVGDETSFKIRYKNNGDVRSDGVAVKSVLPENFIFSTSTAVFNKDGYFLIDKLEPSEEGAFDIFGKFSTGAAESEKIVSQIGFWRNDNFVLQKESELSVSVLGSDLSLELVINGNSKEPLRFGDPVYGAIKFKNTSSKSLEGVTVSAVFETLPLSAGDLVNWSTFKEPFGAKRQLSKVIWDASRVAILNNFNPDEEGNLDFSFNLIDKPTALQDKNYQINFYLEATIAKINGRRVDRVVQSQKLIYQLESDLSFKALGRYFDEDNIALGSGPLPPKVGEKTTYRIFWLIKNSLHDLSDVTVRAKLPRNVSFGPRSIVSKGTLSHTEDEVVWQIGNLSSLISQTEVSFDVGVIPQLGDAGSVLPLLEASEIIAKDTVTGTEIKLTAPQITTEVPDDDEAVGKGAVIP